MSACRYCGRTIRWVTTTNGRMMPIDPDPRPDGNVILRRNPKGAIIAAVVPLDHPNQDLKHVAHFTTCRSYKGRDNRIIPEHPENR